MRKCSGCGVILQTENNAYLGYVKDLSHTLCLDCFNLKNYSKVTQTTQLKGDMPQIKETALIVYVLSVNHFSERFKFRLDRHFMGSRFILVLNHIDTLEKSVNLGRMIHQLKYEAGQLKMKFEAIIPTSALQNYNIDLLIDTIKMNQNNEHVYLVGFQNSGKSLLFRRISEKLRQQTTVLSGKKPGLTLSNFDIPFNHKKLVDTPGVHLDGLIAEYLPYSEYKDILIEQKVKPRNFQLDPLQSIYIGGFAVFSYLEGDKKGITFYHNKNLNLHRTKYDAYERFNQGKGVIYHPGVEDSFKMHTFIVKDDKKYEIAIAEVCFIHIKGKSKIEIYAPIGMHVSMTEALY